ncbi:5991_t:CDS:2 [Paraglomus occultum]|uniref:5991_t:CDS:1 n=1 Tax=Paraglomus occultum TaxID=144539 RepID=A0A9N9BAL4_9GLOM|nr:5991_t:CDS:2 [Paraglomus occultum]
MPSPTHPPQNLAAALPFEVLEMIINDHLCENEYTVIRVPRRKALMNTALVNKNWFNLSMRILWSTIFENGFTLSTLEILLRCLPAETRRDLGIYELLPTGPLLTSYGIYVKSILLEMLFCFVDRWLGENLPDSNTPKKKRAIVRALLEFFNTHNNSGLNKLEIAGLHINRLWARNYEVIFDSSNWIENLQVFVIRAAFDSTSFINRLADVCTKITTLEIDYFNFDGAPETDEIKAALRLITAQKKLRSLTWSSVVSVDPTKLLNALSSISRTLEHIEIEHTDFSNVLSLCPLAQCSNLETMVFKECKNISEQAVQTLEAQQKLTKLKEVKLIRCSHFEALQSFASRRNVLQQGMTFDLPLY